MEWNTIQDLKMYVLKECRLQNNICGKISILYEQNKAYLYIQEKAQVMSQDSIRKIYAYVYT